ncbi:hypothetical protein V5T82_13270 [Magnetovibrio sp. PR-2]|uniref:Acg family FMN-binding oxidoreductase n=1 Tax=Magnetovibrio sp. PR-2 TaxID=3120356 RepID=UPI002FCE2EF5
MNRRKFLKIAGSASVIVAAGGLGFAATRAPSDVLQAWEDAGKLYPDPMRRSLSYAILAPNPHNRQPWLVDLKSETEAVLSCDLDRLLPATDPFSRQIVIGLGCFLEGFVLAAREQGYTADISLFPEGENSEVLDQRPIARLSLHKTPALSPDPLFGAILKRHTNRNVYDTHKAISTEALKALRRSASTGVLIAAIQDEPLLQSLRTLTRDAMFAEMKTPAAHMESVKLMRIGRAEIEANPDGISLGGPLLDTLGVFGVLSRESLTDPNSSAFQSALDITAEAAMSSMGFAWINTADNTRTDQILAGRAYMRLALAATNANLAMQPMSQALQEYPEMKVHYAKAHALLTEKPGQTVQMLARLGYAKPVGPAPRWSLTERLR